MQKLLRIVGLVSIFFTAPNWAAEPSNVYVGLNSGVFIIDDSKYENVTGILVALGFNVTNQVALEVLYGQSNEGDIELSGSSKVSGDTGTYELTTAALYAVFRTENPLYVKGKVGYLYEDIDIDKRGCAECSDIFVDDGGLGFSAALGVGYDFDNMGVELGYTYIDDNVDFMSLSVLLSF